MTALQTAPAPAADHLRDATKMPPADLDTLAERILGHIKGACSKKPASAPDVAALVGGPESHFWAAVEQLRRDHLINTAHIKRAADTAPWLALWPTGLPLRHRTWKDLNAVGAFTALPAGAIPQRMPQRPDPTRDPRPDLRAVTNKEIAMHKDKAFGRIRDAVLALLADRQVGQSLTASELHALIAKDDPEAGVSSVNEACIRLHRNGRIARTTRARPEGGRGPLAVSAFYDIVHKLADTDPAALLPATAQATAAQAFSARNAEPPATPATQTAAAVATAPATPTINFALWDDGGLSIYDGDELLQLQPADTARLARLLGVPASEVAA